MASPDFSQYIDLTVYDIQPEELYSSVNEYTRTAIPEWTPVAGSIEDAIIQAGSLMTSYLLAALNRIPNATLEGLLQLFGVNRNTGTAPTGTVTITAIDDIGYTIPAGTRFGYLDTSDPLNPTLFSFELDAEADIAQGSTTVTTTAITGTVAAEYPVLLSGQTLQLLTPVSYINSVVLDSNLAIGGDEETDAEYLARGIAKLNSYTTALVLPTQYEQYVLTSYTEVYRCKAFSRVNPVNDDYNDAAENGYVTVYACKAGGASLTSTAASTIAEDLMDRSVAGLDITVKAPTIVTVPIAATITVKTGFSAANVITNVENALAQYLHPDYWAWGSKVYYNEIISFIDQVEGVDRVVSLNITTPTGAHLDGAGPDIEFNKLGSLPLVDPTITV